jgi:hypothetical protein
MLGVKPLPAGATVPKGRREDTRLGTLGLKFGQHPAEYLPRCLQHVIVDQASAEGGQRKMNSKTYGYVAAALCAVIAAVHAPGLTHHVHWKATLIWAVVAVLVAVGSTFLPARA